MPGGEQFDSLYPDFASTLYPLGEASGHHVMRNTQGIRDPAQFQLRENLLAQDARDAIAEGGIPIERTFDLAHARQLHAAMFSELYPNWAGVVRPHGMERGW